MGDLSKYWKLVRINAAGEIITDAIPTAEAFLRQHISEAEELQDSMIQQRLLQLYQSDSTQPLAKLCLRCFISAQMQQVCSRLESQFGGTHGFNRRDLLALVLDESQVRPLREPTANSCQNYSQAYSPNSSRNNSRNYSQHHSQKQPVTLSDKILQTFDPSRGGLSTWTVRMVQSHPELDRFLLEHGVYQVSDWAILNSYPAKRLKRILSEIDHLAETEIAQTCALLESYHNVYRGDRQAQAAAPSKRCHPPTEEQLQRIAQAVRAKIGLPLTPSAVLSRLLKLADRLRQHSIWVRGGPPPSASLDLPEVQLQVDRGQAQNPPELDEQIEFLQRYQHQLEQCLEQALAQVLHRWRSNLRKAEAFLTALRLFYCRGMAMGEIAPLVGLEAQYQVTRLLKLKDFRAEVRHHLLEQLRHMVLTLAKEYAQPDRLQHLDQEIDTLLHPQIEKVVEGCPIQSVFAKRLCQLIEAGQVHQPSSFKPATLAVSQGNPCHDESSY